MNPGNQLFLEQRQMLSQNQMQSLQILACNNQELEDLLKDEYAENPMLEHTGPERDDFFANIDTMYERGTSFQSHSTPWDGEDDQRKNDIPSKTYDDLKRDLLAQLCRSAYSEEEWRLLALLTDCLDDSGFFPWEVEEIALFSGCSTATIEKCLADLKELEPIGIFSRNLSECLLKQLEYQNIQDPILLRIVTEYLPDILKGQIGNVSRALHLSTAAVRKYILQIGKLNPRPIMNAQQDDTEYIVPDILVTYKDGEWDITLNDKWMGSYRLDQHYIRMMRSSNDEELNTYFKHHLERARFLLRCVEQRRSTILKITQEMIRRQEPYFLKKAALSPVTMQEIAEALQIHPSTVSRAVRGKYLQHQYGTILMKDLFATGICEHQATEGISTGTIHNCIKTLIAGEEKSKPLSDLALVRLLEQQGIKISRRTVAKYRGEIGIPNSDQRRYLE